MNMTESELDELRSMQPFIDSSFCHIGQHVWLWMGGDTASSTPEPWRRCSCGRYRWDENDEPRWVITGFQG